MNQKPDPKRFAEPECMALMSHKLNISVSGDGASDRFVWTPEIRLHRSVQFKKG